MKTVIIILMALILNTISTMCKEHFEGEIIFKNSYKKMSSDSISVNVDSIVYKSKYSSKVNSVIKTDIDMIRIIKGSYALEGIGVGTLGAIGYTIYSVPEGESVSDKLLLYIAIGGGIGLIIGKATKKYKTIRFDNNTSVSFLNGVEELPEIGIQNINLLS